MKVCLSVTVLLAFVAFSAGQSCEQEVNCIAANGCRCAKTDSPLAVEDTPQFVTISFNDAISEAYYTAYYSPLLSARTNPDGVPVSATFYVPHEYTDYSKVNALYLAGHEIAVHSITKNPISEYWQTATVNTLVQEFDGQRQIIARFANIPDYDIVGARVPNFEVAGDRLFDAYAQAGFEYDATISTMNTDRYFPFSTDIGGQLTCVIGQCPLQAHAGIWTTPIINLIGDEVECNNLQACRIDGTALEIANWLTEQFNALYTTTRAPMNLVASAAWFMTSEAAFEGFQLFLNNVQSKNDVFIVSNRQVVDWMRNPVPVSSYVTDDYPRYATCQVRSCAVPKDEETRYMVSCVACPAVFPWLGNPMGN